jgi:hypothetical protein
VHHAVEPDAIVLRHRLDGAARMHARLPQHLIGDEVPDAGDEGLIHQRGLRAAALAGQPFQEIGSRDRERVGAERAEDRRGLLAVVREPRPAELAHVAVAELVAALELEDDPVVAVALRLVA